jgi:hypothetical protein
MKKLKYFICFAAVMFLITQFAAAQSPSGQPHNVQTGNDAASEFRAAVQQRFNNDVDSFFHVNRWNDMGITKWYSFLQMGDISTTDTTTPAWEGGLGIKLSKAYVSVYYNGRFNNGVNQQGTETTNVQTGDSTKGYNVISATSYPVTPVPGTVGIVDNNFFGVLVGLGNNSFKFTVLDTLTTYDTPVYTNTGFGYTTSGGVAKTVAADATGKYLYRNGTVTPRIQWGAATDMALGKYKTRPSAFISLAINFDEQIFNFVDPDGTEHHVGNYNDNRLTPTLNFDTGAIKFFEGDWGKLSFGGVEEFNITITGEGDQDAVPWGNKLAPYSRFEYQPTSYLKVGAELNVPIHFGWNPNTRYYFGVGARGQGAGAIGGLDNTPVTMAAYLAPDWSTIKTGFQLGLGFIDGITGKPSLFKQINLNWGIKVNLPAYSVLGTSVEARDPVTGDLQTVTETEANVWYRPPNYLQEFSLGLTFFITEKIFIDAGFDLTPTTGTNWKRWGLSESIVLGRVLISLKH